MDKGLVLFVALALAGCSAIPSHQNPYQPYDALLDNTLADPYVPADADGKVSEEAAAARDSATPSNRVLQGYRSKAGSSGKAQPKELPLKERFQWLEEKRYAAYFDPTNQEKIRAYLEAGMTFCSEACRDYFYRLEYTNRRRSHAQRVSSLSGGLIAAGMGLAKSPADHIAAAAALFGYADANFSAYNEAFLVHADTDLVRKLVMQQQAALEREIYEMLTRDSGSEAERIGNVDRATRVLAVYNEQCMFNGMKALVNEALQRATQDISNTQESMGNTLGVSGAATAEERRALRRGR